MVDHPGKERFCWHCGTSMGFIENRYYDRTDVCGSSECNRALQDAYAEERAEAHEQLDRDLGYY